MPSHTGAQTLANRPPFLSQRTRPFPQFDRMVPSFAEPPSSKPAASPFLPRRRRTGRARVIAEISDGRTYTARQGSKFSRLDRRPYATMASSSTCQSSSTHNHPHSRPGMQVSHLRSALYTQHMDLTDAAMLSEEAPYVACARGLSQPF